MQRKTITQLPGHTWYLLWWVHDDGSGSILEEEKLLKKIRGWETRLTYRKRKKYIKKKGLFILIIGWVNFQKVLFFWSSFNYIDWSINFIKINFKIFSKSAINLTKFNYVQFCKKINVKPVDKHLDEGIEGIEEDFSILSEVIMWQNIQYMNLANWSNCKSKWIKIHHRKVYFKRPAGKHCPHILGQTRNQHHASGTKSCGI